MKKYIRLFVLLLAATSARAQTTQITAKFSYDDGTSPAAFLCSASALPTF